MLLFFQQHHFDSLTAAGLGSDSTLPPLLKYARRHRQTETPSALQLCVAFIVCWVYQLLNYPATWGRTQAGRGLWKERVGLAIGCKSTQRVLILNSDWLSYVQIKDCIYVGANHQKSLFCICPGSQVVAVHLSIYIIHLILLLSKPHVHKYFYIQRSDVFVF